MDPSTRRPLVPAFAFALVCLTLPGLRAQQTSEEAAEQARRERPVSAGVAAALAAAMPKYDPPKPVEPKPEEELSDLRETDRPRNSIIRLPDYVVQEKKPPVFRERDLRSGAERRAFAMKTYAGLNLGPLGGMNKNVAVLMLQEEERKEDIVAFSDLARTGSIDDPQAGRYYKKLSDQTYTRSNEWASNPTGGSWAQRNAK